MEISGDNADIHVSGNVWSFLALSAIFLGLMFTASQVIALRTGLRLGQGAMPVPSLESCAEISLDENDEQILRDECMLYDIDALMIAHFTRHECEGIDDSQQVRAMNDEHPIAVNDAVNFMYIGRRLKGTVASISGDMCTIDFLHGNGDEDIYVARLVTVRRQSEDYGRDNATRAPPNDPKTEEPAIQSDIHT